MKVSELAQALKYELVSNDINDKEVVNGYTSDLLSDVMANAHEGSILITIQAHKNTIAVAHLISASAILICNNRSIPEDMEASAAKEKVALLKTKDNQYTASYKIHNLISTITGGTSIIQSVQDEVKREEKDTKKIIKDNLKKGLLNY